MNQLMFIADYSRSLHQDLEAMLAAAACRTQATRPATVRLTGVAAAENPRRSVPHDRRPPTTPEFRRSYTVAVHFCNLG